MTDGEFVILFIFMAVTTMTILVVGTLGAADLLHGHVKSDDSAGRTGSAADAARHSHVASHSEVPRRGLGAQTQTAPQPAAAVVDALMPLGSSSAFLSPPSPTPAEPAGDHDEPPHGRAA